jgi:hypothetical protein
MNSTALGSLFGAPYVPITPYLLPVPLPVHLELYYGEPMIFEGTGTEGDEVIIGYVEQVKARIGAMIDRGLELRKIGSEGAEKKAALGEEARPSEGAENPAGAGAPKGDA